MAITYYNQIVLLNVSEQFAATPNRLQQRCAVVSVGGSTETADTPTYIAGPGLIAALLTTGSPADHLKAFDATWWANGTGTGYYLFEAGSSTSAAVTALAAYIDANPKFIYSWAFLPGMDAESTLQAFVALHTALNALIMFHLPVTASTYSTFATLNTLRSTMATVQTPTAAVTELDSAPYAQYLTNFVPTPTNKLPPSQWTYVQGCTAYALNKTLITAYDAANCNFISQAAEGGIAQNMLVKGVMLDGTPANVKYAIDWIQIQMDLYVANATIGGSNQPQNPLEYDQAGVTTLQSRCVQVANLAIASGLALGPVFTYELDAQTFSSNSGLGLYRGQFAINAVPLSSYKVLNPMDYSQQIYGGLQIDFTPQYGFIQILVALNASQFS